MLPKLNFFLKNQEEFEEGQLVSSQHPFDRLPDKALSDSKPQLPFGFDSQKKQRTHIKATSVDLKEGQENSKTFLPKQKVYSGSRGKNNHFNQKDVRDSRLNKNLQPPKPYSQDPYHLYYGQQKNQYPYPPRNLPYRPPNFGKIHQNQPQFIKQDGYPPFLQYPYTYQINPPPYYPNQTQENRFENKNKEEVKQSSEMIEEMSSKGEEEGSRQKQLAQINESVGIVFDKFDDEDRQIVLEIFQDILQNRKTGCQSLWNFIDKHKGERKQQIGELVFEVLDLLQMDSVMFSLRSIEQQQKQSKLKNGSQIKKLLYSLVAPITLT